MGFLAEAFSPAGFSTLSGDPQPSFQPSAFQTEPFTFQTDVTSVQQAAVIDVALVEAFELAIDTAQLPAKSRSANHAGRPTGQIGTRDSLPGFLDPSTIGPIDTTPQVQQPAIFDAVLREDIYLSLDIEQEAARSIATPPLTTTGQIGTIYSRPSFLDLGMVGPVVPPLPMFQVAATVDIVFDVVVGAIVLISIDTEQVPGRMFARTPFIFYTGQIGTIETKPSQIDLSVIGPVHPPAFTGDRDHLALDMVQAAATLDFELIFATLVAPGEVWVAGQAAFAGAAFTQTAEIQIEGLQPTLAYGWIDPPLRLPIGEPGRAPGDPSGGPYTGPPTSHGPSKNMELLYGDDAVDILEDVLFEDAEFTTSINGEPGTCSFRLRIHPGHPRTLVNGKRLLLRIKGVPEWDGYITSVHRAFFIMKPPTTEAVHYLKVEGVDVNVLFRKRYLLDPEANARLTGKTYVFADTGPVQDIDALRDLFEWLELEGDNLDLTTKLEAVASINIDSDTQPWEGSWTWEEAMIGLAKLPANVWGIDPDRALYWRDVSTLAPVNAPFPLDDEPATHPGTAPYREVEVLQDGSDLITDVMVWGAGTGSKKMKFRRYESDPEGHGLWQYAEKTYVTYSQPSVDKIAYGWIFGSPFNRRGHRLEKVSVNVVTFVSGFRAGMLVDFRCRALGYFDRTPIRFLRITFPAPYLPRYELTMSHEIDAPWGVTDVPGVTKPVVREYPSPETGLGCVFTACKDGWTIGGVVVFSDYFDDRTIPPVGGGWVGNLSPLAVSGPPWCITVLSRGFDSIGSSLVLRMLGGYGSVARSGTTITVTAGIMDQPGYMNSAVNSVSFTQPSGYGGQMFVMKVQILLGKVITKFWYANRREAKAWAVTSGEPDPSADPDLREAVLHEPYVTPPYYSSGLSNPSLYIPSGVAALAVDGSAVAVAGAPGKWWAWFYSDIYSSNHGWNIVHYPGGYTVPSSYPMVTHPGAWPGNGEQDPLDAFLRVHGGPNTSTVPGSSISYGNINRSGRSVTSGGTIEQASSRGIHVYGRVWGWDMIIGAPPSGDGSGIVVEESYDLRGWTPPAGAESCTFRGFVWATQDGTPVGQPPSGEGAIDWEIWQTNYDGSDAGAGGIVSHTVLAAGTLPDFNAGTDTTVHQDFAVTFPVEVGVPFELTARITNSFASWVATFGHQSGLPLAGERRMGLKWGNIRMFYNHVPVANGVVRPCRRAGEHKEVINCSDNPIRLKTGYALGTTRVFRGGLLQRMVTDYVETDPVKGIITFIVTPAPDCDEDLVIYYRAVTVDGRSGLPKQLRKIRG